VVTNIEQVSEARRAGDADPNKTIIAETNKLDGNSSYGKTVTNKERHTDVHKHVHEVIVKLQHPELGVLVDKTANLHFGEQVSEARRAGDADPNKKIIAETNKVDGNSSYGKTVTNKERHTDVIYCQEHICTIRVHAAILEVRAIHKHVHEVIVKLQHPELGVLVDKTANLHG
jgi:hypothetical protein